MSPCSTPRCSLWHQRSSVQSVLGWGRGSLKPRLQRSKEISPSSRPYPSAHCRHLRIHVSCMVWGLPFRMPVILLLTDKIQNSPPTGMVIFLGLSPSYRPGLAGGWGPGGQREGRRKKREEGRLIVWGRGRETKSSDD